MLLEPATNLYIQDVNISTESPLEYWTFGTAGYAIVDPITTNYLEYSRTSDRPFKSSDGSNLSYAGAGQFLSPTHTGYRNTLTGKEMPSMEGEKLRDDFAAVSADLRASASLKRAPEPPNPGEIAMRIHGWEYIDTCYVYPNTDDTCGWIAASIMARWWRCMTDRYLIPDAFLTSLTQGGNLRSSPNFSEYIQSLTGGPNATLPHHIANALRILTAEQSGVGTYDVNWNNLMINAKSTLEDNRPVILFGSLPKTGSDNDTFDHAVVAYGLVNNGDTIVHYGFPSFSQVVLSGGLVGGNVQMDADFGCQCGGTL